MKISRAIRLAKKNRKRIESYSTGMELQSAKSIVFWLLEDPDSSDKEKIDLLKSMLTAKDWKLE